MHLRRVIHCAFVFLWAVGLFYPIPKPYMPPSPWETIPLRRDGGCFNWPRKFEMNEKTPNTAICVVLDQAQASLLRDEYCSWACVQGAYPNK